MKKKDIEFINEKRLFNKQSIVIQSQVRLNLLEQNIFNLFQYIITKAYKKSFSTKCHIPYNAFKVFLGTKVSGVSRNKIIEIINGLQRKNIVFDVIRESKYYIDSNIPGLEKGTYGVSLIGDFFIPQDTTKDIVIDIPDLLREIIKSGTERGYTPLLLHVGKEAKNMYTPRVYDYMMNLINIAYNIRKGKEVEQKISIVKFKKITGIKDDQYTKINDLKKRVIEETKNECLLFGINFTYEFEKEGRKIQNIIFKISKEDIKKSKKYVESQVIIKEEDDIFIRHARELALRDNLIKFDNEITQKNDNIKQIVATNNPLKFKVLFANDSFKIIEFEELAQVVEYNKHRSEKMYVAPDLVSELNNKKAPLYIPNDIPRVPEVEATPDFVSKFSEKCDIVEERQKREKELKELGKKNIKNMNQRELILLKSGNKRDLQRINNELHKQNIKQLKTK